MDIGKFISGIKPALLSRPPEAHAGSLARAAVLAPVACVDGEATLGFIRRLDSLNHHPGQIAFPGGHMERGESPLTTALRETEEETGIKPEQVSVVGFMPPIKTVSTGFIVWPVIGVLNGLPRIRLAPDEADEFFWAPVSYFMDSGNILKSSMAPRGAPEPMMAYRFNGYEIWGLTFRIIREIMTSLVEK